MQILKLKGFLFEPSDPAVYDRDSKTVLELCGRLGYKINELIDEYNRFYQEMLDKYQEAYDYLVTNLPLVVAEQLPIIAPGIMQELWGEDIEGLLQDMNDFKSTFKNYEGLNDLKATGDKAPVGNYVRTLYYLTPGDNGNATYKIVDELEEGEEANDEDIIALGYAEPTTKWAKLVPGEFVKSSCFLSLQNAINYAYARNLDVQVTGYPGEIQMVEEDLIMPFSMDTQGYFIRVFGDSQRKSTIEVGGQIKMNSDAESRNFTFRGIKFQQSEGSTDSLIGFIPSGRGFDIDQPLFDDCYFSGCFIEFTHFYDYSILNCKFQDTKLHFFETSEVLVRDCEFIYSNTFTEIGVQFERCGYSNVLNCNFHSEANCPLALTGSNNINVEDVYYSAYNSTGMGIEACNNCKFENVEVTGALTNLCALGGFNNHHMTFKNFYNHATLNGPTNMNCAIYLDSAGSCTFEGIGSSTDTLIYFNNSGNNVIYSYNNNKLYTARDIVHGTGTSNFIYLETEDDIQYIPSGMSYEIRNEAKFGDTQLMNSLTGYEGRVFYNTDTKSIMIYTNNAWETYGSSGHFDISKINILDFGGNLISWLNRSEVKNDLFLDTTNKPMLIDILNYLIDHNETTYYFVNKSDDYDVFRIYRIRTEFSDPSSTKFCLDVFWCMFDNSMNYDTPYVISGDFYVHMTDGYVDDIYWQTGGAIASFPYITTYNSVDYTPTNSGSPATKGYVDSQVLKFDTMPTADSSMEGKVVQYIGTTDSTYTKGYFYECVYDSGTTSYSWEAISYGGSGSTDFPIYYYKCLNANTNINFYNNNNICTIHSDDQPFFTQVVKEVYDKGYDRFILFLRNYYSGEDLLMVRIGFNQPGTLPDKLQFLKVITTYDFDLIAYNQHSSTGKYTFSFNLEVTQSNGLISSYSQYGTALENGATFLGVNNTHSYTPTQAYHPATKSYADNVVNNTGVLTSDITSTTATISSNKKLHNLGNSYWLSFSAGVNSAQSQNTEFEIARISEQYGPIRIRADLEVVIPITIIHKNGTSSYVCAGYLKARVDTQTSDKWYEITCISSQPVSQTDELYVSTSWIRNEN